MKNDRIMNIGIPLPFDVLLIIQDILNKDMEKRMKDLKSNKSIRSRGRIKCLRLPPDPETGDIYVPGQVVTTTQGLFDL